MKSIASISKIFTETKCTCHDCLQASFLANIEALLPFLDPALSLGDVAREIYDGKGVGGFYAGAVESYCYAVPADIIKFYSYRALKEKYAGLATSPVATKALLGSAASSIAQLTTTPLDVCKIRAIQAGDRGDVSIPRRIADIARDEGPFELFAGVAPRLARAVVSGALQFGSYELAKSLFR